MKIRSLAAIAALCCSALANPAGAQGFVFGTGEAPKPADTAAPGARNAKVETAQRLLARIGLLRETPSGVLTPATADAVRTFAQKQGLPPSTQVNDAFLNVLRRVIWQTQNYSSYKGREKLVDAAGLR